MAKRCCLRILWRFLILIYDGNLDEAWTKVDAGRQVIDKLLNDGKVAYGINTGFGLFSNVMSQMSNSSSCKKI